MQTPTNASLETRRVAAVPRDVSVSLPLFAESARNAELTDVEGRRYIDFAAGIAVLNTGHLHPCRSWLASDSQPDEAEAATDPNWQLSPDNS